MKIFGAVIRLIVKKIICRIIENTRLEEIVPAVFDKRRRRIFFDKFFSQTILTATENNFAERLKILACSNFEEDRFEFREGNEDADFAEGNVSVAEGDSDTALDIDAGKNVLGVGEIFENGEMLVVENA